MKLKALNSIKGIKPEDKYTLPGEIFDVEDKAEAQRLVDQGAAEELITPA